VLALSAFHEQRLLHEDRPMQKVDLVHRRYALLQYNQAISLLRGQGSTGKVPTEVVLATCALFIAIESAMGNLPGAVNHMRGGIQIVRLWKKERAKPGSSRSNSKFIENNLIPIFEHWNQSTFTHGRAAPPISEVELVLDEPESEWLSNILEARASMLRVIRNAQQFIINSGRSEDVDIAHKHAEVFQKHRLLFRIQRWEAALEELLARPSMARISARDRRAIALLRVRHNVVWIAISNAKPTDETSFDAFLPNFEQVVTLAESAAGTECGTSWTQRWANVNFQVENIPHLYLTATKCRNPTIRRKALALLKASFTGHRLWNINSTISMAERVVELEEEGLEDLIDTKGDVVPSEWARIHEIETAPATIDGHRSELVTFKRKMGGKGKHW
jgi:hypothetical protein